ncbi:MAG: EAL domain-containing protein [Candidatus Thiodiazotropha endolucinida]|nr:EAL domain-containing protein [Candidatus Thiodiazotropha taylori]MCW4319604.1 EAL domain-containing protein [Candidatus Thiodiazotropha taylori]
MRLNRERPILPGLDSYRGRYTYLAVLVGAALIAFAFVGWGLVKSSTQAQISNITSRTLASAVLADAQTQLSLIENHLQRILIDTVKDEPKDISNGLIQLEQVLTDLTESLQRLPAGNSDVALALQADQQHLTRQINQLIKVRRDVQAWFPAMQLMLDEMYPYNQRVLGNLQLLQHEFQPDDEEQMDLITQLSSMQRLWLGMTGEFRLVIANRFGIFLAKSNPAPEERYETIINYSARFIERLNILQKYFHQQNSDFVVVEPLRGIEVDYLAWMADFNQVREVMQKPTWRQDLNFMQEQVTPVFNEMRQKLSVVDLSLDTQSAEDITQLTQTAKRLSVSILVMAVMGMMMLVLAYLFIKRNLLQPIADTAHALKMEASGSLDAAKHPSSNLRETRDLVDAFSEMRRQVHSRQNHLDHMAHHDALTQLPNRILFRDRLTHALEIALRGELMVGLMFLDLDRFKQVNDSLGHLVGDELLKVIAERLTSLMRSSDTVARLSGDEFAILIEGINSREDLEPLAVKILNAIKQPINIADNELRVSASIGIAVAPHDDISVEHLLRDADTAMYEAKRQGRSAYRFFSGEMTKRASDSLMLENEIRQAVDSEQFIYHFQPIVETRTGRLFCFEALLRWDHPERGLLDPEVFLDVLDETGLINTLFEPMLAHAIAFQQEQSKERKETVAVSINLSARLLNDPAFCRGLLESLVSGVVPLGSLILEITEDTLTQELAEADVFLQQAKALGARIALDDFGTGQASLSHLRQFPFDILKIDRDFVKNVNVDNYDASLVIAMIQLAHAFQIDVVAEGVESQAQLAFLQQQGCDYIQGYLIGIPQHAAEPLEPISEIPLFQT